MTTKKIKSFNLSSLNNAEDIKEVARTLREFIEENNLYQKIERVNKKTGEVSDKFYANVESWLYAGSLLNMRAIAGEPVNLSSGEEIKYSCTVEVFDFSGEAPVLVSRGTAISSNKEGFFKWAPEFSICSMCQTRAIGKSYRILIGHLLKVAGFESTPSEEMTEIKGGSKTSAPAQLIDKESLIDLIKFTLSLCDSTEDIKRLSAPLGYLTKDTGIRPLLGEAFKELQKLEADTEDTSLE